MKFVISKKDGRLVFYANGANEYDTDRFNEFDLEPTEAEWKQIRESDAVFIEKGKFRFEESEKQKSERSMTDLRQEIAEAKTLDELKVVVEKLLNQQ